MDEQRIVELLTRKIAGEATSEELGELSYLLTKYPDSIYYEALLEQVWSLGKEKSIPATEDDFSRHKLRFKEELKFNAPGAKNRRWAVFSGVLVFVMMGIGAYFVKSRQPLPKTEIIEIIAGRGVRKEIKLMDGTVVRLNSDSKISYAQDMLTKETREVKLTGEAFFNVAHDKEHPFIVITDKVAIKVLGTEFNVREYPGEDESETTLLKGAVELSINARSDQKFVLKPSEKLALVDKKAGKHAKDNNSTLTIENVSPVKLGDKEYIREVSWVENQLLFQNESFEDLLPKLERWYNVRIELKDQNIMAYRFTGIFVDENIVQALEAMKLIKPFNYKLTANEIKIY